MKCDKCHKDFTAGMARILTADYQWLCQGCVPPIHPAHAQNAGVALRVLGLLLLLVLVFGLLWLREVTK